MIHFELNFVKGIRTLLKLIFSPHVCPVLLTLLKKNKQTNYPFSIEMSPSKCQRPVDYIYVSLFLSSLLCSTDLFLCLSPVPHCSDYGSSTVCLEVEYC